MRPGGLSGVGGGVCRQRRRPEHGGRAGGEAAPAGLDWIGALRGPAIRSLVDSGAVQLSLFDEKDLVEIKSDAYPGERLMVCRNPLLAEQRARKREALLDATEELLAPIAAATRRPRLKGEARIGERADKVIGRYKMAKHFEWSIDEQGRFNYRRNASFIVAEAALDGLYVVRTSLPESQLDAPGAVRTHVFLRMLAYHVEWHMRRRLRPMLFDDEGAAVARRSIVAPARKSETARAKASAKHTAEGVPAHSFRTLPADLATVTRNTVAPRLPGAEPFEVMARPTPLQRKAFELLGVRL